MTDIALPHTTPFLANRTLNLSFAPVQGAEPWSSDTEDLSPSSRGHIMTGLNLAARGGHVPTRWPMRYKERSVWGLLGNVLLPDKSQESYLSLSLPHCLPWTRLCKKTLGAAAAILQPRSNKPKTKRNTMRMTEGRERKSSVSHCTSLELPTANHLVVGDN